MEALRTVLKEPPILRLRVLRRLISRTLFLAVLVHTFASLYGATLTITTNRNLPPTTLGATYAVTLQATGGTGPYTWSADQALPNGLSLNPSTGVLSGVLDGNGIGAFLFTISVTDQAGDTGATQFMLLIASRLVISEVYYFPLSWTVGAPYYALARANGGNLPYAWSISAGSLPGGLSFNTTTAEITGTPTTAGVFTFTLHVSESAGTTTTLDVTVTIYPPPVITTSSLPNATIGVPYSAMLSATGGNPPYQFVFHTQPPPWLSLSIAGLLSGTPSASGTVNLSVSVIDKSDKLALRDLTLVVNDTGLLAIVTASPLPGGTVGVQYSQAFSAVNGTPPYTWAMTAGSLPSGLSLGSSGILTGTPAGFAVSNFTVQVTDKAGTTATKSLALNIAPAPLTIVATAVPVGTVGVPYSITFSAAGGTPPYTWFISPGSLSDLALDRDTGVLSGTPRGARTISFGINVQDQNLVHAAMMISIQILSTLAAVNPPLPSAAMGELYTFQLNAQNGVPPYLWSISDGSVLPPGLALISTSGLITGTPTQSGTFHFALDLIDNGGGRLTENLTLKVTGPAHVSGLVCSPTIVSPPGTASCAVSLTNAAGAAGLAVSLSSENSSVTLPGSLLVASGQSKATFTVTVASISTDQTAVITAGDGSSKAVCSLSIAGGPLKVSTLACAPGAVPAGEKSSCIVTLSKPPSSTLTVSLNSAAPILMVPGSLTIDTSHSAGTFQAVAGASLKKQMVLVTASIPGGSSASANVTVLATASEKPVIIAPDSVDSIISSPIQFTASASDPLGRPVVLSADSLPEGATFTAGAGLFQWTPSKTQTGTFAVRINATNSVQLTGSKDVAIRIAAGNSSPLHFVPVAPCRVADTRNTDSAFGGPAISGQGSRDFVVPSSACGIPSTAAAYSLSISVVPHGTLGYLTLWPTGQPRPLAATMSSLDARVKTNAAIISAGTSGAISVFATDPTDVVLDINGYFVPTTDPGALAFYPVAPCRVADTRDSAGPLGAPALPALSTRSFPIQSACGVPPDAKAYSLNFAAVPRGPLGYLTAWPAGQSQPVVASLTAPTGAVTASAVILPAGANGGVDVFPTDDTDLVIDINGYFAQHGPGGMSLYGLAPCRVLDTRIPSGTPAFIGSRDVNVSASGCGVPATAQAYVFNASAVPSGSLGYIAMWPHGAAQPLVATLNAVDGAITSNMAIVPTADGSISVFSSNPTHLVLDIVGYFAP